MKEIFKDIKVGDVVEDINGKKGVVFDVFIQDDSHIGINTKYKVFKVRYCDGGLAQFDTNGCLHYTNIKLLNRVLYR